MRTNLIQNFIHTQTNPSAKKEAPEFDIHHELKNKKFIKPLKGQGRLINDNIFYTPINMAKSISYDIKALSSAAKGDANDHQLGKLNDLGMKIGGLAIAAYLYTKKQTPMTKGMEFVGLGSFFASMALWPKIALQIPAQMIHGFNVQQKYEDSMGRKKPFFQDPQFLPWDLYSDEEINKIGDTMGVPRNIQNRRDFIQEKMKKIAIQNNTLWMLTAGFATPIMSALICNQLEGPFSKIITAIKNHSNHKTIEDFKLSQVKDDSLIKEVNELLSINKNQPLTNKLVEQISNMITKDFISKNLENAVSKDLKNMFESGNKVINDNSINIIVSASKKALEGKIAPEIIEEIIPTQEELLRYFDYEKGYYQAEQTNITLNRIFRDFSRKIISNVEEYKKAHPDTPGLATRTVIANLNRLSAKNNPIMQGLSAETYATLNANNQKTIKKVTRAFNDLKNDLTVLNNYALEQLGNRAETTIANLWADTVKTFIKEIRLTSSQVEALKDDRLPITDVIRKSYDYIASDKTRYKKFVKSMLKQIYKINNTINKLDVNDDLLHKAEATNYDKALDKTFGKFVEKISQIGGLEHVKKELVGSDFYYRFPYNKNGSYKEIYKSMVKHRLLGVKSSFYRIINSIATYRRVAVGNLEELSGFNNLQREIKEDIIEMSKIVGINAHSADFYTKFFYLREADIDPNDKSNIQCKNGKVVYKYIKPEKTAGKIDMPADSTQFKSSMELQYKLKLLPETEELFKPFEGLLDEFNEYRKVIYDKIGDIKYIEKVHHRTFTEANDLNDKVIFELLGAATDQVVHNYCKQTYNTKQWLKTFGTAGAALLGVTVLAQFFFGKMKTPKPIPQTTETKKG